MNSNVGKIVGTVLGVLLIAVCVFLALGIVCVVGQFVFNTFGVGGLVLLCTILACSAMVGSNQ